MAAPHSLPSELDRQKAALRAHALVVRRGLDPALGERVAAHVLADPGLPQGVAIAGVWPLPGEVDMRGLWLALHRRGHRILLPQTPPRGRPLVFRAWRPGCAMVTERFGTQYPEGEIGAPGVIFVPLLAFDAAGHRLGYGGGYYDRTLADLPCVVAVGYGAAAFQVDKVPTGPHDQPLQAVFTENGVAVDHR